MAEQPEKLKPDERIDDDNVAYRLRRRTRPFESVIGVVLFLCGALSIFTTLGIVVVLGNESLLFFARAEWQGTNKTLVTDIDAEQTEFRTSFTGSALETDANIRLQNEIMHVDEYFANNISNDIIGTGAGFERFCAGDTVFSNASREMKDSELEACAANGITPVQLKIGIDALAIVVNQDNDFVDSLTLDEVALLFTTAATWDDVRADFPREPIDRAVPGEDSGTLDFFITEVVDGDRDAVMKALPVTSEDDRQLSRFVAQNEFGTSFFGIAYANSNSSIRVVSLDGVEPTQANSESGDYPLSRPLFLYTSEEALRDRPEVAAFATFYLDTVTDVIGDVGYYPLQPDEYTAQIEKLAAITGMEGEIDPAEYIGSMEIAGSSTVGPITSRIINEFRDGGYIPTVRVERGMEGTTAAEHSSNTEVELGDDVTLQEFFTHMSWQPAIGDFGVLPLVYGTLATTIIAMLVAVPLGLGAAIYLSEYASHRVRSIVKPILEILAGIPTVVFGYFALTFMTPLLRGIFGAGTVSIYNSASAGIVVGILIIPIVSSLSEDALHAVPRALREASYGLGATRQETTVKVVFPAAISGILAAFIVAVSRAIGETMVVAIAAGSGPLNPLNEQIGRYGINVIFQSAETMTGHIARISGGDLSYDSIDYNSIFAIGLLLFVITLVLNIISRSVIARFREAY